MAMIRCPECKHEISDQASRCPDCGFPLSAAMRQALVKIKCEYCGTLITGYESHCNACGAVLPHEEPPVPAPQEEKQPDPETIYKAVNLDESGKWEGTKNAKQSTGEKWNAFAASKKAEVLRWWLAVFMASGVALYGSEGEKGVLTAVLMAVSAFLTVPISRKVIPKMNPKVKLVTVIVCFWVALLCAPDTTRREGTPVQETSMVSVQMLSEQV